MGIKGLEVDTRRLLLTDASRDLRFIFLKPADIPTYVEYGAADLGIVGKDILAEQQPDVYEPVDLGLRLLPAGRRGAARALGARRPDQVVLGPRGDQVPGADRALLSPSAGIQVEMIHLDGSIELAPLVGLAERIVDLVQSGETLRANGLVEVAEIMTSTARLIVNRASLKTAHARVNALIAAMRAGGDQMIRRLETAALGAAGVARALDRSPAAVDAGDPPARRGDRGRRARQGRRGAPGVHRALRPCRRSPPRSSR